MLEVSLTQLEKHMQAVSSALLASDAVALEHACASLRQSAATLSGALAQQNPQSLSPALRQRIQAASAQLAAQRDALARAAALNQRQVSTLLPQADVQATYAAPGAHSGAGATARIYRATT